VAANRLIGRIEDRSSNETRTAIIDFGEGLPSWLKQR
jgi:hypothetical protein